MSSMPATPAAAGPGSWTPATDIQDWKRETRESVTLESSPEIMTVSQTEGRIRIVDMDKFTIGYLSTAVHPDGPGYTLSRDISEALLLRLSKTPDRHGCYELEIINPGLQGRLLFAKFKAASPYIGTGSVNYCCFASSARDYKKHVGPGQSSVWYPCQDGTLDAFWMQDDQTRYLLESAWDPSDMEPGLVPDFAGYDKKRPAFAAFRGGSGSDCEEFISNVRKAAFNVEKLNDDGWQAGYASACLSGDALRFYEGLPEETQASWKLLRTALLEKYPAPLIDVSIQIPEAAGAPGYPPIGAVVFPPESRPVRKTIEVIALWE
ncbi:hypothetical protein FRB90_006069 [Tulasnella sp. 427]|nr:hypothetical protein FRB90_006069 [Tulasnella sp. 427]